MSKKIAGKELVGLLKRRVAYHHSGLDYAKRAGLIEPLAKAGQLQVVVATTGLGAGVNFSMRSVLVTDREYRVDDEFGLLRPDELLQMFGRAGRRGIQMIVVCDCGTSAGSDERGTTLKAPSFKNLGLGRFDRHDDCRSEKVRTLLMPQGGWPYAFFLRKG